MAFKIDREFFERADSHGREEMRSHLLSKHPNYVPGKYMIVFSNDKDIKASSILIQIK